MQRPSNSSGEPERLSKMGGACPRIRIPDWLVDAALGSAPSEITLGAREPDNRLILDAEEPRVRFGSGAETNIWLDVQFEDGSPRFVREPGSIARLRQSAHLCDQLEHLDFFIRNVNIQDPEITEKNKDVNQFYTSLNNITKHVQAGLTSLEALDDIVRLGEIVAGGPDAFESEPVLSFITCVIKSPLQFVDDTTTKLIEISRRGVPVVISSCPMGGATGPFDEFAMVAQINANCSLGLLSTSLSRRALRCCTAPSLSARGLTISTICMLRPSSFTTTSTAPRWPAITVCRATRLRAWAIPRPRASRRLSRRCLR